MSEFHRGVRSLTENSRENVLLWPPMLLSLLQENPTLHITPSPPGVFDGYSHLNSCARSFQSPKMRGRYRSQNWLILLRSSCYMRLN